MVRAQQARDHVQNSMTDGFDPSNQRFIGKNKFINTHLMGDT